MQVGQAKKIGESVLNIINPYIVKAEITGSIRRNKPECKDIDIVILLKKDFLVRENLLIKLRDMGKIEMQGADIIRVIHNEGIELDIYLAKNEINYEVIKFIRTGSAQHNIKMAQRALSKGMQLKYDQGIIDKETGKTLASSEKDIFKILDMDYIEPEKRI